MYKLSIRKDTGEEMTLTGNPAFDVLKVEGTNPPAANITTAVVAGVDGTRFTSSRINQRNIVITLNIKPPIEKNRTELYSFFKAKDHVKVLYKNAYRDVYTYGYIETIENNPFGQTQRPTISIICPQPFWLASGETVAYFSYSQALFEFPFSIPAEGIEFSTRQRLTSTVINAGAIPTGGIITLTACDDGITNPIFTNVRNMQAFGVDITMQNGDIIVIDTITGEKSMKLIRGGVETNLLSQRMAASQWITFEAGANTISIAAEPNTDKLDCEVMLVQKFQGV